MIKTKPELIERCCTLRREGFTLGEIMKTTGLPKITIYSYIRNIPLSLEIKERIKRESAKRIKEYIQKERKGKCWPGREFIKPQEWSLELIFIVSHFMFDGRIKHEGCEYYNRSNSLIRSMKKTMKYLFGLDSKIYKRDFGVKQLRYYNVELGDYAERKSAELLDYIENASIEEKKVFLKSFFDDEGSVRIYKNIRLIRGFQHNLKILKLVQKLLQDLNIQSRIDEKYKEIGISRKEDIIKFRDKINFSEGIYINPNRKNSTWKQKLEKREILEKVVNSYKS